MLQQLKNLSKVRKLLLIYSFLTQACNVFLIAVTATLIIQYFDALGIILRDYSAPIFGLLLFIPKVSKYIVDNPFKCYPYIVAIEITCVTGYMVVAQGFYPVPILLLSMFFLGSCNTLVRPLRTKNSSQVIKGDGEFAVLAERFSSLAMVIVTVIGVAMTTYHVNTLVNAFLSITFIALSRWVYHYFLIELNKSEEGESDVKAVPAT